MDDISFEPETASITGVILDVYKRQPMKPTPMAATMAKRHLDRGQHKNSSTINPAVPASSVHTVETVSYTHLFC